MFADGTPISLHLAQSSTNSQQGTSVVIDGWIEGVEKFLAENQLNWEQVCGVGLAIPGPYQAYGVLDRSANLPAAFAGWDFHADYSRALSQRAGRPVPLVVGNDGNYGGVAEAAKVRGDKKASVLMLAPGSGLGAAYMNSQGLPLDGDTLAGMEAAHLPAPLHLLDVKSYPCGCGRTWGCVEVYTTLSGLPFLLAERLDTRPDHELARSPLGPKERAFALRGLAQKGDALALELFDLQARAMGLHVATLAMVLDPQFVVIGGGLMDPEATTPKFRERYLRLVREAAEPYLWPAQRKVLTIVPAALGDLSQAIGAALVALYQSELAGRMAEAR